MPVGLPPHLLAPLFGVLRTTYPLLRVHASFSGNPLGEPLDNVDLAVHFGEELPRGTWLSHVVLRLQEGVLASTEYLCGAGASPPPWRSRRRSPKASARSRSEAGLGTHVLIRVRDGLIPLSCQLLNSLGHAALARARTVETAVHARHLSFAVTIRQVEAARVLVHIGGIEFHSDSADVRVRVKVAQRHGARFEGIGSGVGLAGVAPPVPVAVGLSGVEDAWTVVLPKKNAVSIHIPGGTPANVSTCRRLSGNQVTARVTGSRRAACLRAARMQLWKGGLHDRFEGPGTSREAHASTAHDPQHTCSQRDAPGSTVHSRLLGETTVGERRWITDVMEREPHAGTMNGQTSPRQVPVESMAKWRGHLPRRGGQDLRRFRLPPPNGWSGTPRSTNAT
ncbi:hypothetical protein STIAU_5630 [Stigmatella aurantiaca DW4/3-1]|nr:hypothetical protein STIAU_5630 [Stigmatella aurantiaca DW4/3-1]